MYCLISIPICMRYLSKLRSGSAVRTVALLAMVAILAVACSAPRDMVSVVDRPESTEGGAETEARLPTLPLTDMPAGYDTVAVRPFDLGKMWMLDNIPADHFADTYDIHPDEDWKTHMQQAALRFGTTCSAGFVSEDGLMVTNHHCARTHITAVQEQGERLDQDGFLASTPDEERATPDLHVDKLVDTRDVTNRIYRGARTLRSHVRTERVNSLERELNAQARERDANLRVSVVPTYRGARYKAYTYRRYTDVRLVMAPEQRIGFFGGDTDNFTYPRYNLDVAFYRVYEDDEPVRPTNHFTWSHERGSEAGMPVFTVGTPGSTDRLSTVSQMEYERDHGIPNQLTFLSNRIDVMKAFLEANPEEEAPDLRNTLFSLMNSRKNLEGQQVGLDDPHFIARRTANERALQDSIRSVDTLRQRYGGLTRDMEQLQQSKASVNRRGKAFNGFANTNIGSRILTRGMYGYYMSQLRRSRGAQRDAQLEQAITEADQIKDWPAEVEEQLLARRLEDLQDAYGASDPTMRQLFEDRTPREWAEYLVEESRLFTKEGADRLFDRGYRDSNDPSLRLIEGLAPLYFSIVEQQQDLRASEVSINARLNRARLAVFDERRIASDATSTPRISDGRVQGYTVDDTTHVAPYTTFEGLYTRADEKDGESWTLPSRWMEAASDSTFLNVPLNKVSTNDIAGGNSGSPLVNSDLELVGVAFDSNYEALPNRFLYRDEQARAISVDSRGIIAALERIYNADALVDELVQGRLPDQEMAAQQ